MRVLTILLLATGLLACSDDGGGNEADRLGVGAECTQDEDCRSDADAGIVMSCLDFRGGYCGVEGCSSNADCPQGSACVLHDDNVNYCFRTCEDKPECNANRTEANEANCSASIEWVDDDMDGKACVPPSS